MSDIKFNCPKCNAEFTVSDSLAGRLVECSQCKTRIRIPKANIISCNKCGSIVEPEAIFCSKCGEKISKSNPDLLQTSFGGTDTHKQTCPKCGSIRYEPFHKYCEDCNDKQKPERQESTFVISTANPMFYPAIKIQKWIQYLSNISFVLILIILFIPILQLPQIQSDYSGSYTFLFFLLGSYRTFLLIALVVILRHQARYPFIIGVYLLLLIWDFSGFILQLELETIGRNRFAVGVPSLTSTPTVLLIGTFIIIGITIALIKGLKRNLKVVLNFLRLTIIVHLFFKFIMWVGTYGKDSIDISFLPSTFLQDALLFERNISFILIVYFTLSFISTVSSNAKRSKV